MKIYKANSKKTQEEQGIVEKTLNNELLIEKKIDNLISSFKELKLTQYGFEDLIVSIFKKANYETYIPRKGNVNERFDLLLVKDNVNYVVEIEVPSTAILDAPRNLLDNMAVLINRRKLAENTVVPVVICWEFPNNRSDYWNVINDVNKILKKEIKTISVVALAILYWSNQEIDLLSDSYYLNSDNDRWLKNISHFLHLNKITDEKFEKFLKPQK